MTDAERSPAADGSAVGDDRYSDFLKRAVLDPESLSQRDVGQIKPGDWALLGQALERVSRRSVFVHPRRQAELLRAARAGCLRVSALPIDELVAIDATPGLSSAICAAMAGVDDEEEWG
jgi:hypothetical protein